MNWARTSRDLCLLLLSIVEVLIKTSHIQEMDMCRYGR